MSLEAIAHLDTLAERGYTVIAAGVDTGTTGAGDTARDQGRRHRDMGRPHMARRAWHKAERSRWSLIATFARWWVKQNFDITGTLPQTVYEAFER